MATDDLCVNGYTLVCNNGNDLSFICIVCPIKYVHFCSDLFSAVVILVSVDSCDAFTHIPLAFFTGTDAIPWLADWQ